MFAMIGNEFHEKPSWNVHEIIVLKYFLLGNGTRLYERNKVVSDEGALSENLNRFNWAKEH